MMTATQFQLNLGQRHILTHSLHSVQSLDHFEPHIFLSGKNAET